MCINAVVLAVVFPTISAVLIPIARQQIVHHNNAIVNRDAIVPHNDNVGTSKLESRIALLEKEVQNLRLDMSANRNQLTSVWAQLRVKTDELASVKTEMKTLKDDFRSLLTDIALLKRDQQMLPDRTEIALMKADVARLKADPKPPPPPPPPPPTPKPEVTPPPRDKELETKILKISFQLNKTITDVQDLEKWKEETTAQLKLDKENTQGDITAIQALTAVNKEDVQKAFTNIESLDRKVTENFTSVASQAQKSDLLTWFNISRVEEDLDKINKNLTLRIDYAGMNVGFQASQKTDNDSTILLKYREVHYNDGNAYNITTGYFTAPVAGTYMFWLNVVFMNSRGSVSIVKGFAILASGYSRLSFPTNGPASFMRHDTATAMAVSHVNKGEHVFFTIGPNSVKTRQEVSHFGGVLVHYDDITILPYKKRK